MLKDIIHIFIFSCKKVSLLTEKQLHTKLSGMERFQLMLHFSLCKLCVCNKEKTIIIHNIIANKMKNIDNQKCKFDDNEIDQMKLNIKRNTCNNPN